MSVNLLVSRVSKPLISSFNKITDNKKTFETIRKLVLNILLSGIIIYMLSYLKHINGIMLTAIALIFLVICLTLSFIYNKYDFTVIRFVVVNQFIAFNLSTILNLVFYLGIMVLFFSLKNDYDTIMLAYKSTYAMPYNVSLNYTNGFGHINPNLIKK